MTADEPIEWASMARAAGFEPERGSILVTLQEGRRHRVGIENAGAAWRFHAVVAPASDDENAADVLLWIWTRNRTRSPVGFRLDERDRVIGEIFMAKLGATADEFEWHVRMLAQECDRWERRIQAVDRY